MNPLPPSRVVEGVGSRFVSVAARRVSAFKGLGRLESGALRWISTRSREFGVFEEQPDPSTNFIY